jgi:hypothetical protein
VLLRCEHAWVLCLATGCSSLLGLDEPAPIADAGTGDGIDAIVPADGANCFGSGTFTVCLDALPTAAVSLPQALNTDTSPLCMAIPASWIALGQGPACFVIAPDLTVNGALRVTGSRPLVMLGTAQIKVDASIDIASHGATAGAGAQSSQCVTPPTGQNDSLGGGGGAGGTFMSVGGSGGAGNGGTATGATAPPATSSKPSTLHGGCRGSPGGASVASAFGAGGGAIYLIAGAQLILSSGVSINASGAGAPKDSRHSGGAGGGSGGMIVLFAPTIVASNATLIANGGAGAGAGSQNQTGVPGMDPSVASPTQPAIGGVGVQGSGAGGNGAAGSSLAVDGGNGGGGAGGGGGGGGVGYIRANVALTSTTASPAIEIVP